MTSEIAHRRLREAIAAQQSMPLDRDHLTLPLLTDVTGWRLPDETDEMIDPKDLEAAADQIAERVRAKLKPMLDEQLSRAGAEAGRFERRVEGWDTWQTVGAFLVALCIGIAIGWFLG